MAALERKRMKMLLSLSLRVRQKAKECKMLKKKNQSMLAEEAPRQKMVNDFMVFLEAIDRNDTETVGEFDEKSMMITIRSMMKGGGGHSRHY
ncbi:hypothetical protein V6N13_066790 [Hibiscus sabdariffa]|uniref:Uncharacterized protein n=1 Tax=Hibiscus sabdariffa TaxID=183260 RepID=A0ABR2DRI1_9ROSI